MVFSEPVFLFAFLPVALVLVAVCARRPVLHSSALLGLSLAFYTWSSGRLVFLLIGCLVANWALARAIERSGDRRWLSLGFVVNFLPLAYYKYAFFAASQIDRISGAAWAPGFADVVLPVGISFFVFQGVSYLVDVARGDTRAEPNPIHFGAYLAFFPQLIAGPIVRYRDAIEDYRAPAHSLDRAAYGARRFAHGLLKKILIADTVAPIADACFATGGDALSMGAAWLGALAYSIQIYFDFSGYSDMAIGLAAICGIDLRENFERPYASATLTEFWRRWHISLSSWFRDYLYIPLGGNRAGTARVYANLLVVFFTTGLWHGAAWSFVAWGLYHGLFLIGERLLIPRERLAAAGLFSRFAYAFPVTVVGWVVFRADSLGEAIEYVGAMFTPSPNPAALPALVEQAATPATIAVLLLGTSCFFMPREGRPAVWLREAVAGPADWGRTVYLTLALAVSGLLALTSGFSPFLYFRF
ncbi:MAG: membrane-bound O-acyltransferase family protein [Deltaproteobacteria bacterium]|nr:membrane-bound O-acyltransferase family protein [Deltaproteobacteria bacterium]